MTMVNLLNGDAQPDLAENAQAPQAPVQEKVPENTDGGESKAEDRKYAGRFNSIEELEKGYDALNSQQGSRGNELGALQTQITEQNRQMAELISNQSQQPQAPQRDLESERMAIGTQMDDGDLSIPEGLAQLRKLDALENEGVMQGQMQQMQDTFNQQLAERDQDVVTNRFHEANPDFLQLQQSGELQKVIDTNEFIGDEYQAYLTLQAQNAFTKGKDEAASEIDGSAPAAAVSSNAGSQMRNETPAQPQGRMTDANNLESGLAALEKAGFSLNME